MWSLTSSLPVVTPALCQIRADMGHRWSVAHITDRPKVKFGIAYAL
jgi:hypothetical protein